MIVKFFNRPSFYLVISLFFASILFLTAKSMAYNASGAQLTTTTETYSHTLENVPIDIQYDTEHYFISGYAYEAEVYLTATNRIKLDSEINRSTRNFKLVAALDGKQEGTVDVPVKAVGLPTGVTARVLPESISVTIGKKVSRSFEVRGAVPDEQLAAGYTIDKIETGLKEVMVTSNQAMIDQIDHVQAVLPQEVTLAKNFSAPVTLQAVTADGTILASVIEPAKTQLEVGIKKLTKTVPLQLELVGQLPEQFATLDYKLSQETVTISGTKEDLDSIDSFVQTVDISQLTANETKKVDLSSDKFAVEPKQITIKFITRNN